MLCLLCWCITGAKRRKIYNRRQARANVEPTQRTRKKTYGYMLKGRKTCNRRRWWWNTVAERVSGPVRASREVNLHVDVKRQTANANLYHVTIFLICRLPFIISTHKLAVSRNLLSIGIVLSSFYLLIFYFEKFSTWIWRLLFTVYVKLELSSNKAKRNKKTFSLKWYVVCVRNTPAQQSICLFPATT